VPPLAQSANAEAIAGESSAVPLEEAYLEGMVQVFPTVEFCAKAAEAHRLTKRSGEIMFAVPWTSENEDARDYLEEGNIMSL
jgi:hypothetical protein